nr:YadA C-terminal domain-containing protein [uncultured Moellerella sp.]
MKLNKIALILMTSSCAFTYIGAVSASTTAPAPVVNKDDKKEGSCVASLFASCEVVTEAVAAETKTNQDGTKTTIEAKPATYSKKAIYPELFDVDGKSLVDSVSTVQKSTASAVKNTLDTSNSNKVKLDSTISDVNKHTTEIGANKKSIETNVKNITANKENISNNKKSVSDNKQHIGRVERNVQLLEKRINDFDDKMKRGFATQSALSGLFQPYSVGKVNLTAALGGYETTTAIAIGTGYRFDEKVAAKAGLSTNVGGFDEISYNVGINIEW